jgi:hypothetical protein
MKKYHLIIKFCYYYLLYMILFRKHNYITSLKNSKNRDITLMVNHV